MFEGCDLFVVVVEFAEQLALEHCFLSKEKAKFVDAGVFEDIQVYVFDLFLIQVVLDHIQHFFVLEDLLVVVEYLDVLPQDELIGNVQLLSVVLYLLLLGQFLHVLVALGVFLLPVEP